MAEYLALPSCIKLHMQRISVKEEGGRCVPRNSPFRATLSCRTFYHGRDQVVRLSVNKNFELRSLGVENLKVHPYPRESSSRCSCLGFLINPDGATASDWVPVGDQVLLMASIFLTYLAGVIPVRKSNISYQKEILDKNAFLKSSTSPGSAGKDDDKANLKHPWQAVQEKLLDSLDAIEQSSNLGNGVEFEQKQAARPLSLFAISEGAPDTVDMDNWMMVFSKIIREACQPVCLAWLEKEFCLENRNFDEALIMEKVKGDDSILQTIIKSGKGDLYAELVYFLRYGTLRKGSTYDYSVFALYAESILEDLVITLADGIASIYLELISVDGDFSNEINSLGLAMCNLSTRSLQKLRNEVALKLWLYENVEAVVSMYEDCFDLCTFQSQLIKEPSRDRRTENYSWWKNLIQRKSGPVTSASSYVKIMSISISVKRTKELRALKGRYYFSLFLELSDISMPFIRALFDKISNAISFFLVCLIGRSLGLIYTGIRQSLRWK
ncbi:hypothetical protein CUMW_049660 [Citrus unshiu]|nr:hypothetical protein CUMW_049660 [Citrus unshiu]